MKNPLFSIAAAAALLMSAGLAVAQTTTTTTSQWTNDQGKTFTEYSTSKKYNSFSDPTLKPAVGMVLPGTVTVYTLPETMHITTPDNYRYGIVNDRPVVIETTTRKVVHSWD
jgi:hypothetical protein